MSTTTDDSIEEILEGCFETYKEQEFYQQDDIKIFGNKINYFHEDQETYEHQTYKKIVCYEEFS